LMDFDAGPNTGLENPLRFLGRRTASWGAAKAPRTDF